MSPSPPASSTRLMISLPVRCVYLLGLLRESPPQQGFCQSCSRHTRGVKRSAVGTWQVLHKSLLNEWLHRQSRGVHQPQLCCSVGDQHLEGRAGWLHAFWGHLPAHDSLALPADINECVTDMHTCSRSEHCVNTVGSFRCYKALTCEPGYMLKDGECTGEEGQLETPPPPTSPCP